MDNRNKKLKILPIILFVLLLFVVGFLVASIPYIRFKEESHILEKGVEYVPEDLVAKANGEINPEAELINTKEVGKFEFHYKVKKPFFEKDVVLVYEVVDTTPPIINFKENRVDKDPNEEYSDKQIRENISINEGTYVYETDYDSYLAGPYTVKVTASDEYGNVSEASYEVNVKDLEPPVVFASGDGAGYYTDSEFNIMDIIAFGDNADPDPVLSVDGEVDTSKPGEYTLHAKVIDSSNNVTEWDLTVEVADDFPSHEPSDYYYPFEEFLEDYKGGNRMFGIDVSSWQGDIDFEKVRDAGCEFVIIRIGFSYQGVFTLDNRFRHNLERAKAAGLKVGIYHFSYDNNEEEVLSALNEIFTELHGEKLELPIVFDWE
ncbi:MAG: hypothetical protein J6S49_05640, partial [Erysipelotrichaceae bacterium]|nr:hypothetical protein [Erysipelotrichaceae bacterium]